MKTLPVLCCGPDADPLDPSASQSLAARFRALSDPTRVAIVNRLASTEECCVCDLTAAFELSQPTISHHLKVLRDAGLVSERRDGTRRLYSVRSEGLADLHRFLADVMPIALGRLKEAVEEDQRSAGGAASRN